MVLLLSEQIWIDKSTWEKNKARNAAKSKKKIKKKTEVMVIWVNTTSHGTLKTPSDST